MKYKHLLLEYDKIHSGNLGTGMFLRIKDHLIQRGSRPINNLYWTWHDSINDKSIGMHDFKYVGYEDQVMISVKPFKKR